MSSTAEKSEFDFRAIRVELTDDQLCVTLTDGREVRSPLEFYPKLARAEKKCEPISASWPKELVLNGRIWMSICLSRVSYWGTGLLTGDEQPFSFAKHTVLIFQTGSSLPGPGTNTWF